MYVPARWVKRYRGRNGMEYCLRCPRCMHSNLWWNADMQGGRCFSCPGQPGLSARDMARLFGRVSGRELPVPIKPTVTKPKITYPYQEHWAAKWHLEEVRKCLPEQVKDFQYEEATDRIWAPLFRIDGEPTKAFMSRHTDPDRRGWKVEPKGTTRAEHWFLRKEQISLDLVVLVEGIFDVLTPALEPWAIATLGTKITEPMQDWFWDNGDRIGTLVIWYDPDVSGVKGAENAKVILTGAVSNVLVITDVPEPGDLTPREAREVLSSRAQIPIHL